MERSDGTLNPTVLVAPEMLLLNCRAGLLTLSGCRVMVLMVLMVLVVRTVPEVWKLKVQQLRLRSY